MIKFFRKIRQKMLAENKFSKYLIYAIGEIILVVIGILIALYLNDLKDQNNEKSLQKYYIKAIKTDLERDQILIEKIMDTVQAQLAVIDTQVDRIYSRSATMDTLFKIARYEFRTNAFSITYNDNSLKSLVSTGNLNLFETDLSELLLDLDKAHREENENTKSLTLMLNGRLNVYETRYTHYYQELPENNLIDNIIWAEIDTREFTGKFRGMLFVKRYRDREFLKSLKVVNTKTTFLINYIKNNYE